MKKLLFSVAAVLITSTVNAQKQTNEIQAVSIPVSYNGLTGSLINYLEPVGTVNEITKTPKIGYHPKGDWILNESVNPNALPQGEDPALQKHYSPANTNALTQSWDGITNFNTNPADPAVDVGPNHVVQMTNGPSGAYIQVYSKTGGAIGSQIYFDNFMNMPGGLGDPIVLYDERADRWMLSEFSSSGDNMHIAISQTADPTGAYYTFSFNSPNFPDYPKYSIWNDAYIITTNESGNSPVYAINRADLLSGTPTSAQRFTVPSYGTIGFQATTPVSLLGTTNPPAGAPPMVMRMRDDAWSGVANDALEIWEINLDWSNSSNSSINQITTLNMTLPFDSELCGYTSFSCIDQPGSNTNLDPLREVLMNRIMYRNFSTHESIVCCHVTDVSGNDQAGIRWYELRRTGGAAGSWILYQESTYAPDTDSRWMPSIGISASGNIGLAYNVSSSSTYPSLRYTGRKECDPLDQMTEPETSIATGTTNNNSNRYGDYNSMGVDPSDGETFYFTGVYNPTSSGSTRIGAFNIELCNQDPAVQFDIATAIVNETDATTASSSCLDYQVINVPISIGLSPTQNADITVLVTGGSATLGEDFTLNNSTFTLAGSVLTATAEVWVYNDNIVEGTENIILGYTLNANGGDAVSAIANQLVDITINDNDLDPTSIVNDATLLTENFESGFGGFTTINASGDTPFQIGDATNASTQPMTFPATNTSNFVWINDDNCDCDQDNVDLNFPPINLTGFTSGTLSFLSYFEGKTWDNNTETAEIYVSIDGGAATLVQPITTDVVWMTQNVDLSPYTGNNNVVFSIKYSDGTGYLYGMGVDDVSIISQGPIGIQTDMNSSAGMTANLAPNTTVYFYDTTSTNVMLSLENTSSFDYGCVTVEVDRDGTSALQFNTANPNDFLHSKTFKVTPTNSNPNGTYNVTLYYKESEVAGWESITGNSRNDAEIIKVDGSNAINDVNPSNANSFSISSSASVLGSFYSDVTFTGVFSSGFSGLGVGVYNSTGPVAPTANFTSNTSSTCEGNEINFTDLSGGGPTSWMWTFGDGNSSTSQNPTHIYNAAGIYNVTLTASNSEGSDVSTQTSMITVLNEIASSQAFEICDGSSIDIGTSTYNSAGVYIDTIPNLNGCDSIITTNLSILSSSSLSLSYTICQGSSLTVGNNTYSNAGTYTEIYSNNLGCDSIVNTTIIFNPSPIVSTSPNSIGPLCSYETSVTMVGIPSGGVFSGVGVTGSIFNPSSSGPGVHLITYTFTDENGCEGYRVLYAEVLDCAGLSEESISGISLDPNPNDGNFVITGLDKGTDYKVYDYKGRLVISSTYTSGEEYVTIPEVNAGVYYLRATKDGKEGGIKFLIAK
ncbi:MAG: PKD domain-containing protein [Crocinitomicaceae bacterium]